MMKHTETSDSDKIKPQKKLKWSKPEIIVLSVKNKTLGNHPHGNDFNNRTS